MNDSIFKKVIFVAPHNKKWKGGISSVINEYKRTIENSFNYFPSTYSPNIRYTFLVFPFLLVGFVIKLLFNQQFKIVHIHGASVGSFYRKYVFFLISKYIFRKRVLYHIHGARYHLFYAESSPIVKKLVQHIVNKSDGVIVLSESWKVFFANNFTPKRIYILSNIVGYAPPLNKYIVDNKSTLKLLFLGRIGDRKGIFDLLQLLVERKKEIDGKLELIVGGDGEVQRLINFVKTNDLTNTVKFVGFVEGKDKKQILTNSDIYILPSYNEGLPISILEAMSYSMPIISTNVGGIPEIVDNNLNGLLVDPGDKVALFKAIKVFFENRQKVTSFGKRSYEKVKNYFPEAVKCQLNDIYKEVIENIEEK